MLLFICYYISTEKPILKPFCQFILYVTRFNFQTRPFWDCSPRFESKTEFPKINRACPCSTITQELYIDLIRIQLSRSHP